MFRGYQSVVKIRAFLYGFMYFSRLFIITKFTEHNKTKLTISESLSRHSFQMAYFLLYNFLQVSVHSASVRLRMVKGHIKLSLEIKSKWGPKERSSKVMFPPVSSREEWVDNYRLRWKQRTTRPISSQWRMSLEKYKAWNGTTTQNFWFTGYLASFYVCMNSYFSWNIEFFAKGLKCRLGILPNSLRVLYQ